MAAPQHHEVYADKPTAKAADPAAQVLVDCDFAIKGEITANHVYALSAEIALKEGFPLVAKLFRAAAEAEGIHERRLRKIHPQSPVVVDVKTLKAHNSTIENLKEALKAEDYEWESMYPGFSDNAEKAQNSKARKVFDQNGKAEAVHAKLYKAALASVQAGKDWAEGAKVFVCQECGNIEIEGAPELCPICKHPQRFFKEHL